MGKVLKRKGDKNMKKMRKIFAVLLTLAMVLGMSMTSFAAGTTATINLSGDTLTKDTVIKYLQIVEPDTTSTLQMYL